MPIVDHSKHLNTPKQVVCHGKLTLFVYRNVTPLELKNAKGTMSANNFLKKKSLSSQENRNFDMEPECKEISMTKEGSFSLKQN